MEQVIGTPLLVTPVAPGEEQKLPDVTCAGAVATVTVTGAEVVAGTGGAVVTGAALAVLGVAAVAVGAGVGAMVVAGATVVAVDVVVTATVMVVRAVPLLLLAQPVTKRAATARMARARW